ncbi:MAG: DUF2339 domain-containing protein [Aquamicrobium sp.]|uniref:DUF2339 domain-containing protein n=1 Tax=Aquamicrobium sp. TaxID=1872579 RepID=UPI00349EC321|nr:DUF2339 domain-containing protein [Aquamicrobium sp.]
MELIVLLALVAGGIAIRKQGQRLRALEQELASFRMRLAGGAPVAAAADGPLDQPVELPAREIADEPAGPVEAEEPAGMPGPWAQAAMSAADESDRIGEAPAPEQAPQQARPPRRDLETALGTRWAVWVGGLALALGGVFLVRYSIEAGIFGPRVRLAAAALFGIILAAAGELARRRGFRAPIGGVNGAYVPAILTAAATFTLFSTVFAAHALYGFIGTATAFGLLAVITLGTMGLALLHGQALAGLGLLGSYLTPVLVSSDSPAVWTLFGYLAIVLVAAVAIASLRRWRFLAGAAYVGAGLWSTAYISESFAVDAAPLAFLWLVGLVALAGLWLARPGSKEEEAAPRLDPASLVAAFFLFVTATFLARGADGAPIGAGYWAAGLLLAALAVAAWRARAVPLLHAFGIAMLFIAGWAILGGSVDIDILYGRLLFDGVWLQPGADAFQSWSFLLAVAMLAVGIALARLRVTAQPGNAAAWAFWAALVPLWTVLTAWLTLGNLNVDWRFAFAALALSAILAAAAELTARAEDPAQAGGRAVSCFAAGSAVALTLALLAGFGPLLTTVLTGLAAIVPAAVTRLRRWPVLGWLSAGFAAVTLGRVGADPTIVGTDALSTTPFLNALTPGYFLPAAAFAWAAWQLARTTGRRARLMMEAFAALFVLLGAAMLTRHAMNGGVIGPGEPSLAEQAIYSLIMIGGGAILLALDRRSPSPVFRWGSIGLGVLSVLTIASSHLLALNPLFTNDTTGTIPVFNLLMLAYLLPALALAGLAWRARGLRPDWYVAMLAAGAVALAFAWVSLSIRRLFHGEFIGAWKGMGAVETYTYSAVWLALGVAVLVAGLRFRSRGLRLGSAALVVLAVAKVFLYDMRELEGVLRALSFMGLGAVLIGIGMFYQRMLPAAHARGEEGEGEEEAA